MLLTGSLRFVLVKIGCVILYLTEAYLILPVAVIVPKLSVKPTIVCVEMENILITSCLQKWSSGFGSTCLPILNIGRLGRFFYAFSRINRVHQLRFNTIIPIMFNELDGINILRNRIAHHEPICFARRQPEISMFYILNAYQNLQKLFLWMGIDSHSLLYGLDHVRKVCGRIMKLASLDL